MPSPILVQFAADIPWKQLISAQIFNIAGKKIDMLLFAFTIQCSIFAHSLFVLRKVLGERQDNWRAAIVFSDMVVSPVLVVVFSVFELLIYRQTCDKTCHGIAGVVSIC